MSNPWKTNAFNIDDNTLHGQRALENAAVLAHEANRYYCLSMDDTSQKSWAESPDWQKDSALAGVKQISDNPDGTTPEKSHEGWMKLKFDEGWVYGPTKDPEKKTHPCLVPYAELPPFQRHKDSIFGAVVREALGCYGGRAMRYHKRKLGEIETYLVCDDPTETHGLVLTLGRAHQIAQRAARAYLRATNYPIHVDGDSDRGDEFHNMVTSCAMHDTVELSFDAFRASKFPYIVYDLPTFTQINAGAQPSFATEGQMRSRVMWFLTFGITKAVMWTEGVKFAPRFSARRLAWALSSVAAVADVAEVIKDSIADDDEK